MVLSPSQIILYFARCVDIFFEDENGMSTWAKFASPGLAFLDFLETLETGSDLKMIWEGLIWGENWFLLFIGKEKAFKPSHVPYRHMPT